MNILSAVKNTAFSAAVTATLNYLEQDPEQNIPKAMGLMDKVLPDGWYERSEEHTSELQSQR